MFSKYFTVWLILITVLWISAEVLGLEIWGGRVENVLVLEEGTEPGQMKVIKRDFWYVYPNAIDIDLNGNIYLHDLCNGRIQVFSSSGKFLREIKINKLLKDRVADGEINGLDVASDNEDNVYLIDLVEGDNHGLYLRLVKFYYNEKMVTRFVVLDTFELRINALPYIGINTDYFGNVYFYVFHFGDDYSKIYLYERGASLKTQFDVQADTSPPQIVQKADSLGRIIFFQNGYLHLTNISEVESGILKNSIKEPEELTSAFTLVGFDLNFNIYLLEKSHWVYKASEIAAAGTFITILHRYKIEQGKLTPTGRVFLNFSKGISLEEQKKMDTKFVKRYVVAGNGEVYFLHGTIDKLYVSKITFEELKDKK